MEIDGDDAAWLRGQTLPDGIEVEELDEVEWFGAAYDRAPGSLLYVPTAERAVDRAVSRYMARAEPEPAPIAISLFSGCGGFDLGMHEAGVDVVAASEMDALAGLAFLYTGTEKGNHSGIRFMMTVDDARAWCESPISRGVLMGTEWAYFWTSVANFVMCYWGGREPEIDISNLVDNGTWDERIASLSLRKIGISEFADVLGPLGVKVIRNADASTAARLRAGDADLVEVAA